MSTHRNLDTLAGGNRIRDSLNKIRRFYGLTLTGPRLVNDAGPVSGTGPASQPPIHLDVVTTRSDTLHDLRFWSMFILDEVNGGTITTRVHHDLDDMAAFIARWCDAVLEQLPGDGANLDEEMHEHAWALECLARGWRTKKIPIGDCPEDVVLTTSEGYPKLDGDGRPMRLPCIGRLHALVRESDTILPKEIRCDRTEDHRWSPHQFTALGRRLGSPVSA